MKNLSIHGLHENSTGQELSVNIWSPRKQHRTLLTSGFVVSMKTAQDMNNLSLHGLLKTAHDINNLSIRGLQENSTGLE
jgi:hypothetical protein